VRCGRSLWRWPPRKTWSRPRSSPALGSRQRSAPRRTGIGVFLLGIIIVAGGVVLLVVDIRMHSRPGPTAAATDANVPGRQ